MDLDVIIFAWTDFDWNLLFSFELYRNIRFSFGTTGYCRTAGLQWIAATNTLEAIFCRHNAASPWVNQKTFEPMILGMIAFAIYTFDQVHSSIAATNPTLYVA